MFALNKCSIHFCRSQAVAIACHILGWLSSGPSVFHSLSLATYCYLKRFVFMHTRHEPLAVEKQFVVSRFPHKQVCCLHDSVSSVCTQKLDKFSIIIIGTCTYVTVIIEKHTVIITIATISSRSKMCKCVACYGNFYTVIRRQRNCTLLLQ